jgi:hypothetical protein
MQHTLPEGTARLLTARATQLAPSAVTASAVEGSANRSVVCRVSSTTSGSSNAAQSHWILDAAPKKTPRVWYKSVPYFTGFSI